MTTQVKTAAGGFQPGRLSGTFALFVTFAIASTSAFADVALKLGDILVAEPGNAAISVVDPSTGARTVISQGGLLSPMHKTVGVALAPNGEVIVVHRLTGLIRVNPATGSQTILSTGGHFADPWAIAINQDTGDIYVADSGFDQDRPEINQAGKIIRVDPVSGSQQIIASGSPCTVFPSGAACRNTTSAGSYLSHPYGIAIDYAVSPGTLVVADMGSFNGKGAIIRIQPSPNGTQTLLWGPASAVPAPQVVQQSPLACPMGVTVEPTGNILTTVFTYPVPPSPTMPPPAGTYYGCTPPGIFRVDLVNNVQSVVNTNAPDWQPDHAYAAGSVIRDSSTGVHRVVTAGVSQGTPPAWNETLNGPTIDGSVGWQNIGLGANWVIPFGVDTEPAPTPSDPSHYNIIVGDEGHSMLFRLAANGEVVAAPLATDTSYVTSIDVITSLPPGGSAPPPVRSNGQPTGILPSGTTQATLSLSTVENATCRYALQEGVAYGSMTNTFSTTGATSHAHDLNGLTTGSHQFYVRCSNLAGNPNTDDFEIAFSVADPSTPGSSFSGAEAPLSEGGTWDSPGSWADLQKDDGAFAAGLNAQARLVTPLLAPDQYSEITYSQDPGAASWVGVTTRVQGAADGSGYLAIAYAGEVRLYRVDDSGSLNFTMLAAAAADLDTAPRRLRLQSEGNNHRVFLNGVQVISQNAGSPVYATGQPGIAASVFGGPQVKILGFESGSLNGGPTDTTPPSRSNGQPAGTFPLGTTQAALSLTTGENATCRYSTQPSVPYGSMTNTFTTTDGASHTKVVTGLTDGSSYTFNVRCIDGAGNANPDDFVIAFSVANPSTPSSNFAGTENPLSENGTWDSAGSWADLRKDDGVFADGLNAQARLVAPLLAADQYAEITYGQDPGAGSWVGVMTRVQGASDGGGYLAIVYAGEVRLYRVNDAGGLNFTMLGAAAGDIGAAPRRLRLESVGSTHRVYFNGTQVISHNAATFATGQPGIAASVFGGPQVKILGFESGSLNGGPTDTTPPSRSNGQPAGTFPLGTTQAALSLTTGENATCRYSTQPSVPYASMTNTFTSTDGASHTKVVTGLTDGSSYTFNVRCIDGAGNANPDDFVIAFSVANPSTPSSNFAGTENPLSENGTWDSAGSWADLRKDDGVFADGLNAQARLVAPLLAADQYAEITYGQDPGAGSWGGVMTRVQGASDGGGYLAIVYAGEVRLYRVNDAGGLNFTMLGAAAVDIGAAPRRLRLESVGSTHRVYFNGTQVISHNATTFATGQPGIAASVFGGPQVKILSFKSGNAGN
jgi:hypothetical protein